MKKQTHGGKRTGSGRKKKEPTKVVRVPTSKLEEVKKLIKHIMTKQPYTFKLDKKLLDQLKKESKKQLNRSFNNYVESLLMSHQDRCKNG